MEISMTTAISTKLVNSILWTICVWGLITSEVFVMTILPFKFGIIPDHTSSTLLIPCAFLAVGVIPYVLFYLPLSLFLYAKKQHIHDLESGLRALHHKKICTHAAIVLVLWILFYALGISA
jgi:hypothetical protein